MIARGGAAGGKGTRPLDAADFSLALLFGATTFIGAAWLGWLFGHGLNGPLAMAAALGATMAMLRAGGLSWRAAAGSTLSMLSLAALAALAAATLHELSDDGQQYHHQAVMEMSRGWNPLREWSVPADNLEAVWINGYAKSHWVYAALLHRLGAGIEAGKSFSWLIAVAAGLLVHALLTKRLGWGGRGAALVAVIATLNPVVAYQWPTLLNDQILACLMLLAFASLAWAFGAPPSIAERRRDAVLIATVFALMASVKASGVAFGGLIVLACLPLVAWGGGSAAARRLGGAAIAGLAVGVLVLGFNPYVTNTIRHGHPFHPLAGPGKIDIIRHNIPPGVQELSRPAKLVRSLAARSSSVLDPSYQGPPLLAPKIPGDVSLAELKPFLHKNFVHIGGFGPWFSLALLLSLLGAAWALTTRRRSAWRRGMLVLPPLLLLGIALAFPEPWWARYVPHLWLVPVVVAVALVSLGRDEHDARLRRVGWGVLAVSAINALGVALVFVVGTVPRQLDLRTQLESLRALSQEQPLKVDFSRAPAMALTFDEAGIRWRDIGEAGDCGAGAAWVDIEYTLVRACLDPAQRSRHRVNSPWVEARKAQLQSLLGRSGSGPVSGR